MSFLKDPSLVGKNDEFGQLKYKLNLDEEAVLKFYGSIYDQKDMLKELYHKYLKQTFANNEEEAIE